MKTDLKQLSQEELFHLIERLGEKPYRGRQLINWIYKKIATSFDDMTDLSKKLREKLDNSCYLSNITLLREEASRDGTRKFLFQLNDGETIESVLIPHNTDKERQTLCISSQVGCAMGCKFCTTGKLGLKRNLKACEIVDQVIAVSRLIARDADGLKEKRDNSGITNIVLMGMGEPLNNLDQVVHALRRITALMGFSKRKVTLSTVGIVPKIYELAGRGPEINLAISLNATTDESRNLIMPVNKKYPLDKLMKACREFPLSPRRRITFEYVMLENINDSNEDALRLVTLLRGIKAKVNLIPCNPTHAVSRLNSSDENRQFKKPAENRVREFQKILHKAGIAAIIRKSKGADISAACGQLKAAYSNTEELFITE